MTNALVPPDPTAFVFTPQDIGAIELVLILAIVGLVAIALYDLSPGWSWKR